MSRTGLLRATAGSLLLALASGAGVPLLDLATRERAPACCSAGRCCCDGRRGDDGVTCVRRACGCERPEASDLQQPARQDAVLDPSTFVGRGLPDSGSVRGTDGRALSRRDAPPVPPPKPRP